MLETKLPWHATICTLIYQCQFGGGRVPIFGLTFESTFLGGWGVLVLDQPFESNRPTPIDCSDNVTDLILRLNYLAQVITFIVNDTT